MATSERPLGHHFLEMPAFLTILIRKLFMIAKESFLYVQRSLHIIWSKLEPSVSTHTKNVLWFNIMDGWSLHKANSRSSRRQNEVLAVTWGEL